MLSDSTIAAIIVGIPTFLASLAAFINSLRNSTQVAKVVQRVTENNAEVVKLGEHVNGKMTEMLEITGRANRAEARNEAIEEERFRPADLVVDPQQVQTALQGTEVRKQIDAIEATVIEKKGNGGT